MTRRLHRYYGTHDRHFITSSCYRRRPELGSAWRRDLFVKILEEARRKYRFVVHGYVVMPEHFLVEGASRLGAAGEDSRNHAVTVLFRRSHPSAVAYLVIPSGPPSPDPEPPSRL